MRTETRNGADEHVVRDPDDAIIVVEDLHKHFGSVVAVDGISFTVRRGEVFGILGPNGAGKTTTLEIIETLQKPTRGRVAVEGIDTQRDAWAVKSRIGVQLQSAGFYPELSLVQLLKMFAALYNVEVDPIALLNRAPQALSARGESGILLRSALGRSEAAVLARNHAPAPAFGHLPG
jgi:ABC-type branched-subunit amino acid transport system ATPase component